MVDGVRIHRTIGRESENVSRTQAEGFITKARSDAKEGRLSLAKGRKLHLTFAADADLYLNRLKEIGFKDYVNNEQHLRLHLTSPLKKASLTGFHATAKHIAAKAVSPSSETMRTI